IVRIAHRLNKLTISLEPFPISPSMLSSRPLCLKERQALSRFAAIAIHVLKFLCELGARFRSNSLSDFRRRESTEQPVSLSGKEKGPQARTGCGPLSLKRTKVLSGV